MPPEYIKTRKYDGCQATVWQMGILLVDMLSPVVTAYEKPQHCLSMAPRIPPHLSPGIGWFSSFWYFLYHYSIFSRLYGVVTSCMTSNLHMRKRSRSLLAQSHSQSLRPLWPAVVKKFPEPLVKGTRALGTRRLLVCKISRFLAFPTSHKWFCIWENLCHFFHLLILMTYFFLLFSAQRRSTLLPHCWTLHQKTDQLLNRLNSTRGSPCQTRLLSLNQYLYHQDLSWPSINATSVCPSSKLNHHKRNTLQPKIYDEWQPLVEYERWYSRRWTIKKYVYIKTLLKRGL